MNEKKKYKKNYFNNEYWRERFFSVLTVAGATERGMERKVRRNRVEIKYSLDTHAHFTLISMISLNHITFSAIKMLNYLIFSIKYDLFAGI